MIEQTLKQYQSEKIKNLTILFIPFESNIHKKQIKTIQKNLFELELANGEIIICIQYENRTIYIKHKIINKITLKHLLDTLLIHQHSFKQINESEFYDYTNSTKIAFTIYLETNTNIFDNQIEINHSLSHRK